MEYYLAGRIISGARTYSEVITKRPELKAAIDAVLTERKHPELIETTTA